MQSSLIVFATVGALAACAADPADDALERRKPKHPVVVDAPTSGMVSCYSQHDPAATCTLPTPCCFASESQHHDGTCSTSSCAWGTIACDGPEDCASGEHCCATYTTAGVELACQTGACLPPPYGDELCHEPSICADGRWCITAFGTQPALPRTLAVCR